MTGPGPTRALSWSAARRCEEAQEAVCRCRCGGQLHGARRVKSVGDLPLDDPHSPSRACPKCKGLGKVRTAYIVDTEIVRSEAKCEKCGGSGRILPPEPRRKDG